VEHLPDDLVQVPVLHQEASLPGVGEHLPGELRGAVDDLLQVAQRGMGRRLGAEPRLGKVQVAQHGGQQVVEVVGDAPGQQAEALQLLHVLHLLLHELALPLRRPSFQLCRGATREDAQQGGRLLGVGLRLPLHHGKHAPGPPGLVQERAAHIGVDPQLPEQIELRKAFLDAFGVGAGLTAVDLGARRPRKGVLKARDYLAIQEHR